MITLNIKIRNIHIFCTTYWFNNPIHYWVLTMICVVSHYLSYYNITDYSQCYTFHLHDLLITGSLYLLILFSPSILPVYFAHPLTHLLCFPTHLHLPRKYILTLNRKKLNFVAFSPCQSQIIIYRGTGYFIP